MFCSSSKMIHLKKLDYILDVIHTHSKDLALIINNDLAIETDVDIADLENYLQVLKNRGYITYKKNSSYINLNGQIALESSKNGTPFQDEERAKKLSKHWTTIKLIAATFNAIAILGLAFWSAFQNSKQNKLERENILLNQKIDSVQNILNSSSKFGKKEN